MAAPDFVRDLSRQNHLWVWQHSWFGFKPEISGFVQLVFSVRTLRAPGGKGLSKVWGCSSEALGCAKCLMISVLLPPASSTHSTPRRCRAWGWGLTEMFTWRAACRNVEFGPKCGSSLLRTFLYHGCDSWQRSHHSRVNLSQDCHSSKGTGFYNVDLWTLGNQPAVRCIFLFSEFFQGLVFNL